MPCGRTMFVWAWCDECGDSFDSDYYEYIDKVEAVQMARDRGWTVRKNGEVICDKCKSKARKSKEDAHE